MPRKYINLYDGGWATLLGLKLSQMPRGEALCHNTKHCSDRATVIVTTLGIRVPTCTDETCVLFALAAAHKLRNPN